MTEQEYLITCLMEECAEVIQRCSKALRFGMGEIQPNQMKTNAERIIYELADLTAVAELLYETGCMPKVDASCFDAKREKLAKYMAYSREIGVLS